MQDKDSLLGLTKDVGISKEVTDTTEDVGISKEVTDSESIDKVKSVETCGTDCKNTILETDESVNESSSKESVIEKNMSLGPTAISNEALSLITADNESITEMKAGDDGTGDFEIKDISGPDSDKTTTDKSSLPSGKVVSGGLSLVGAYSDSDTDTSADT